MSGSASERDGEPQAVLKVTLARLLRRGKRRHLVGWEPRCQGRLDPVEAEQTGRGELVDASPGVVDIHVGGTHRAGGDPLGSQQ